MNNETFQVMRRFLFSPLASSFSISGSFLVLYSNSCDRKICLDLMELFLRNRESRWICTAERHLGRESEALFFFYFLLLSLPPPLYLSKNCALLRFAKLEDDCSCYCVFSVLPQGGCSDS